MINIIISSGYFNPLHEGHLSYLREAKKLAETGYHICIVNNDKQVKVKGSVPFHTEQTRLNLISELKCVDIAILSIDNDLSVSKTIDQLCKNLAIDESLPVYQIFFVNGGDRNSKTSSTAENETCIKHNIICLYGIGGENKENSSSDLIRKSNAYLICK